APCGHAGCRSRPRPARAVEDRRGACTRSGAGRRDPPATRVDGTGNGLAHGRRSRQSPPASIGARGIADGRLRASDHRGTRASPARPARPGWSRGFVCHRRSTRGPDRRSRRAGAAFRTRTIRLLTMSTQGTDRQDANALRRALAAIQDLRARLEAAESGNREPIAIVGIGCRFPGPGVDPEAFWDMLDRGESAVVEVPVDRWDLEEWYDPDPEKPGKTYSRHGAFVRDIDQFDASFFEISPREARTLDPQHRMLLEVSWQALENAAINPASVRGRDVGVFVG